MEKDNAFLKISTIILKIFSYIFIALAISGALLILFGKTPATGKLASLGVLLVGGLYSFLLYLVSELISKILEMDDVLKKMLNAVSTAKKEIPIGA